MYLLTSYWKKSFLAHTYQLSLAKVVLYEFTMCLTQKNMLYLLKNLLFIFYVSEVNCAFSNLDSCSKTNSIKLDICVVGNQSYIPPLPTVLETTLYLIEIVKIDGNENSISIFVELSTSWKDNKLASTVSSE